MVSATEINAVNLYILSNYEKGKLRTSRPISIREKRRLKTSVEIMSMILSELECKDCQTEQINIFIDRHRGVIFPIDCNHCETLLYTNYSDKQKEILKLMDSLLYSMGLILSEFWIGKKKMQELFYLLHAFHNLPKAFFNRSSKLFMSCDDVLKYANEWLSQIHIPG